jgi:short-subunit dehydrogenase
MSTSPAYTLVTGASSGIGEAIAREYANRGRALILLARRRERLEALARELAPKVAVEVLVADLADRTAPAAIEAELRGRDLRLQGLVNNAGYGLPGAYHVPDWEQHARFLQVMINAVCELSWRLLPQLKEHGRGEILNVASLAGLVPGSAGHTLYAAAKAFMIKFSESLALENSASGLRVSALCPGFTYSEFHDVTGTRDQVSKMPSWMWLDAAQVAQEGIDALQAGRAVYVPGRANRLIKALVQTLPDRWALRLVQKRSRDFRSLD